MTKRGCLPLLMAMVFCAGCSDDDFSSALGACENRAFFRLGVHPKDDSYLERKVEHISDCLSDEGKATSKQEIQKAIYFTERERVRKNADLNEE